MRTFLYWGLRAAISIRWDVLFDSGYGFRASVRQPVRRCKATDIRPRDAGPDGVERG